MKDSIVKEIERMVAVRAERMVSGDLKYQEKYEDLTSMLRELIQDAELLKKEMDENHLTFSAIEAEGYMRFALAVKCLLED
ncbi:coil containing protein [Vibrio phage 1.081.O._10N.286.52.C2]|nr:coil containing protein [Vibrio phage 1.081.O._10N.286.52.C2]